MPSIVTPKRTPLLPRLGKMLMSDDPFGTVHAAKNNSAGYASTVPQRVPAPPSPSYVGVAPAFPSARTGRSFNSFTFGKTSGWPHMPPDSISTPHPANSTPFGRSVDRQFDRDAVESQFRDAYDAQRSAARDRLHSGTLHTYGTMGVRSDYGQGLLDRGVDAQIRSNQLRTAAMSPFNAAWLRSGGGGGYGGNSISPSDVQLANPTPAAYAPGSTIPALGGGTIVSTANPRGGVKLSMVPRVEGPAFTQQMRQSQIDRNMAARQADRERREDATFARYALAHGLQAARMRYRNVYDRQVAKTSTAEQTPIPVSLSPESSMNTQQRLDMLRKIQRNFGAIGYTGLPTPDLSTAIVPRR